MDQRVLGGKVPKSGRDRLRCVMLSVLNVDEIAATIEVRLGSITPITEARFK